MLEVGSSRIRRCLSEFGVQANFGHIYVNSGKQRTPKLESSYTYIHEI